MQPKFPLLLIPIFFYPTADLRNLSWRLDLCFCDASRNKHTHTHTHPHTPTPTDTHLGKKVNSGNAVFAKQSASTRGKSKRKRTNKKTTENENRRIQEAYNLAAMIYGKGKAKVLWRKEESVGNFKKFAPCRFHRICIRARRGLHRKHDGGLEIRDIPLPFCLTYIHTYIDR